MPNVYLSSTPGQFALTGNSMKIAFQASGLEDTYYARVIVHISVFNNETFAFEKIAEDAQTFDKNASATLYIQEIFSDEKLNYKVSDLSGGTFDFIRYKLSYKMEWFDEYGENFSTDFIDSQELLALPCGISREYEGFLYDNGLESEDIYDMLGSRFLSNHPKIKRIYLNQYDFLSFLTLNNAANLKLLISYDNGATETVYTEIDPDANNKIMMIGVDPSVEFGSGKTNFRITLKNGTQVLDYRDYYIVATTTKNCFYFRNSFGTIDSVFCSGLLSSERKFSENIYQAGKIEKPSLQNTDIVTERKIYNTTYTADIGYHNDRDYQDFLTELFISDDVWRSEDDKMIPIIIINKKYLVDNEPANNIFSVEVQWQHAFDERFITKENIIPAYRANHILDSDGNRISDNDSNHILYI